jgi:predicted dehydrogenase
MMEPGGDRRTFLRQATALSLAAGLGRAEADEMKEKVRVAVVGAGGRGSDLVRALTTIQRADIVAVCDDYEPHREQGLKYAGEGAKPFADYATMLREVRPEAVVVAVPLHLHYEVSRAAIEAGAAVFCEKTMCQTVKQARDLAVAVEKVGAVFQVGLQRRANAVYRQAKAMIEAGMLGRISAIKCQWHRHNNWRRPVPVPRGDAQWAGLEKRLNWRLYREFSGGLMTELAAHQLDVVNWFLGATPRSAVGSGGIDFWRDGRDVFDNVFCVYDYELPIPSAERGTGSAERKKPTSTEYSVPSMSSSDRYTVRVTYSSLQNNAYEGAAELILGTKGTLFLTQKKGLFYQEQAPLGPGWAGEGRAREDAALITSGKTLKMTNDPWSHRGKPYEIDTDGDDTRDELIEFLQCVARSETVTICDAATGAANTATVLLGNRAMDERRAIAYSSL